MQENEKPAATPLTGEAAAVAAAAMASATEGMIIRLAETAEKLGRAMDIVASPELLELLNQVRQSAPALTRALKRVEELERTGALDSVLDLVDVVHAARVSMGDAMVARMANGVRTAMELMDVLMVSGIPDRAPALLNATIEARDAAAADKSFIGPLDFLSAPKEPELQFLLRFVLALARRLPKAMQGESNP